MLAHATSGRQRRLQDDKALHVPVRNGPVVRLDVLDVEVRPLRLDGEPPHGGIGGKELGPADRQVRVRSARSAARRSRREAQRDHEKQGPGERGALAIHRAASAAAIRLRLAPMMSVRFPLGSKTTTYGSPRIRGPRSFTKGLLKSTRLSFRTAMSLRVAMICRSFLSTRWHGPHQSAYTSNTVYLPGTRCFLSNPMDSPFFERTTTSASFE